MSDPRPVLTPAVISNADILRRLAAPNAPADSVAFAKETGREAFNLRRSLTRLEEAGAITVGDAWPPTLTDSGRLAVRALDIAEGRAAPEIGDDAPSRYFTTHDKLRPNPNNPRKHFDPDADAQLADTIAEVGVLQNVLAGPADDDGARILFAGERRWRAVGKLIADGLVPSSFPIPFVEVTLGDEDDLLSTPEYVALVENGQRDDLNDLEKARAYAGLIARTGWSASEAARRTGGNARVVQEGLKVLRETSPEALERYERGEITWEALRLGVRAPGSPLGGVTGAMLDPETPMMFEAPTLPTPAMVEAEQALSDSRETARLPGDRAESSHPARDGRAPEASLSLTTTPALDLSAEALSSAERVALAEIAHKIGEAHQPFADTFCAAVGHHWKSRIAQDLIAKGLIMLVAPKIGERHCVLLTAKAVALLQAYIQNDVWTPANALHIDVLAMIYADNDIPDETGFDAPSKAGDDTAVAQYITDFLNIPADTVTLGPQREVEGPPPGRPRSVPTENLDADGDEEQALAAEGAVNLLARVFGVARGGELPAASLLAFARETGLDGPWEADENEKNGGIAGALSITDSHFLQVCEESAPLPDTRIAHAVIIAGLLNFALSTLRDRRVGFVTTEYPEAVVTADALTPSQARQILILVKHQALSPETAIGKGNDGALNPAMIGAALTPKNLVDNVLRNERRYFLTPLGQAVAREIEAQAEASAARDEEPGDEAGA